MVSCKARVRLDMGLTKSFGGWKAQSERLHSLLLAQRSDLDWQVMNYASSFLSLNPSSPESFQWVSFAVSTSYNWSVRRIFCSSPGNASVETGISSFML